MVFIKNIFQDIGRNLGSILFAISITALVAITSWAACFNVVRYGWTADAAAWAQSAGSIIAIAGAAWLARSEFTQIRRWRREQGEEAAWGTRFILSQAKLDVQIIAAEMTSEHRSYNKADLRCWKQRASNASLFLQSMLARVDHIHPVVVVTTCNAKILVDQLLLDLEKIENTTTEGSEILDEILEDVVSVYVSLEALIDQYDERIRGIRHALDRGHDMLPIDELYEKAMSNSKSRPDYRTK